MKVKASNTLISLLEHVAQEEQRQPKHFHASSLRDCGRRMILGLLGYKERRISKPEWIRAAQMGNMIHDSITEHCKALGILEAAELPLDVDPEYNVSGRVDAVISRNGNRRVLEIKSMSAERFQTFYPRGSEKFEDAYAQLLWYCFSLHLDGGFILAVNRDNLAYKEFAVLYDDQYVLTLMARMRRLKTHLDNKLLPEPERGESCKFCGFRKTEHCNEGRQESWL